MRIKRDQEFCQSLSRKELQCLCKKYGLPANKSSSEMANSLASFFEKNLSSLSPRGRLFGIREASLPTFVISGLQPESPFHSLEDARKDSKGLNSCSGEEQSRKKCSQTVKINELGYCACDKTYDKEGRGCSMYCFQETSNLPFLSECDRNDLNRKESPTAILCKNYSGIARDFKMDTCQIQHADVNLVSYPEENVLPSSMRMFETVSSSSFDFYVHSEDGINLCVDLNSNPSDWIRKLKSEVNMGDNKSCSFHQELGRFGESNKQITSSFPWTVDADQIKDGHVRSGSSPSTFMKENDHVELNNQDGGDGSLTSSAIEPSGIAVVSENLLEDQGVNSSEPHSDAHDDIRSCTDKNGSMTTLDLDAVNTPMKKLAGKGKDLQERSELIDGEEGSEWLQFEDSFEKTCSGIDVESNEELSKKGTDIEFEDRNCCGKPDAKISRGTKHFAGKVLPRISTQLVSK